MKRVNVNVRSLRTAALALLLGAVVGNAGAQGDAQRGKYLTTVGGCLGCHTEENATAFAGGRALTTPFGVFYGPNITPDMQQGIGRWAEADFMRAMRFGERPDGANYFPAFPYPSFTRLSDSDVRDLWAYLRTLPPSSRANKTHELRFPFSWRSLVSMWKWLFFTPGPSPGNLPQPVKRGAYLVETLGHCGECHTPRNFLGATKRERLLAGGKTPDGKRIPNLTPTRLKKWDDQELKEFLQTGLTPDGDVASEVMGEVIRNSTSQLTPEDLAALVAYLRALAPLADEPR